MGKNLSVVCGDTCTACYCCMQACARECHNSVHPLDSALQILPPIHEDSPPHQIFCSACPDPACAQACPVECLQPRTGGGVEWKEEDCLGCGDCAAACKSGALRMRNNVPLVCTHCGICATFCPRGILTLEEAVHG